MPQDTVLWGRWKPYILDERDYEIWRGNVDFTDSKKAREVGERKLEVLRKEPKYAGKLLKLKIMAKL